MAGPIPMDDAERRRQAKAEADALIQQGKITTDAELDAFMASRGIRPLAPSDATAVQPVNAAAKYNGARAMLPGEGMVRQMARGATMGVSDRALAGIVAGLDPKVDYDSARTRIDNENRRYEAENPALALTWNMVGGALPGPANAFAKGVSKAADVLVQGRGLGKSMARGALTAPTVGAAGAVGYQRGEDDKSAERSVLNALFGATTAGALGTAAPVVGKAGTFAADLTGARLAGKPLTPGTVPEVPGGGTANPLRRDFWTGQNAKRLATRGEGLLYPTPAGRMVDQKMIDLADDAGRSTVDEAQASFRDLDGLTGNAMVLDVLGDRGLRAARGARSVGNTASGTFSDAFDARRATLSANMEDDVQTLLGARENVPQGIDARRAQRSANAKQAYAPVMGDQVPLSPEGIGTLTEDPQQLWQKAWESGAMTAQREMPSRTLPPLFGQVATSNGGTRVALLRQPTVEDIDTMKKGLNVIVNNKADAASAQVRNDARALSARLDALLGEADAASPGYAAARKQFGDDSEIIDAFEGMASGVDNPFRATPRFTQATRDQVQAFFDKLSSAGRSEAQRGIAQDLFRAVDQNAKSALTNASAPTRSGFGQKMQIAFADKPDVATDLSKRWNARDLQEKNAAFIQGGSPTADKLIDAVEAASLPGRVGQLTYAPERGLAALLGQKAISTLQKTMADELATRAVLNGPEGAQYLQYLKDYQRGLGPRATARRAAGARTIGTTLGMREALAALFGGDAP